MAETEVSAPGPTQAAQTPEREEAEPRSIRSLLRSAEIDSRMAGMLAALAIIWIVFQIITPRHTFFTPRNLWNLSVQTSVVAIMATGMVLIIVTRNIDLSVGAVMAVVGMVMAVAQTDWLPDLDRVRSSVHVDRRRRARAGPWLRDRGLPGGDRRVRRRPFVHRDPRRVPGVARGRVVDRQRTDDRPDGHALPAPRRWRRRDDRWDLELDRRGGRVRRDRGDAGDAATAARPVRLPPATDVGRGRARRGRVRRGARWPSGT